MNMFLYLGTVFFGPGCYAVYLSVKESQVSGILHRRRQARLAREREARLRRGWRAKNLKQAAALEAWRGKRDLPERVSA
jgi:hypothetical protein